MPILEDVLSRMMRTPACIAAGDVPAEALQAVAAKSEHEVLIARWTATGKVRRYSLKRLDAVRLLCGPQAPSMPRPGDWFCKLCKTRNMSVHFFCCACGPHVAGATANAPGIAHISGGSKHFRATDWGCGHCYAGNCSWNRSVRIAGGRGRMTRSPRPPSPRK